MSRLILLFLIAVAVYLLIKSFRRETPRQGQAVVEDMVRCAQCGVHLPKSESIEVDGKYFCSKAHRDAQHR